MIPQVIPNHKKSSLLITQSIASGAIGIIFWVFLARFMDMRDFGEFSAARSVLSIAILLSSLGMGTLVTKEYGKSYMSGQWEFARGMRRSIPVMLITACLICFFVLVAFHATAYEETAVRLESFIAVLALLPLYVFAGFMGASSSAYGAPARSSAIIGWGWGALSIAVLFIFTVFQGYKIGVIDAATICAIAAATTLLFVYLLAKLVEPAEIKSGENFFDRISWVKSGLAIALASVSAVILDRGGLIVLGWVHADAEAAARLSSASKLSSVLLGLAFGLGRAYRPLLAQAVAAENSKQIKKLLFAWIRTISIPIFVLGATLLIFGKHFLGLYGEEYVAGYWTLVVYVFSYGAAALIYLGRPLYQFFGCSKQVLIIMASVAVLGIVGMVLLASIWSDFGVALATAISINSGIGLIFLLCVRKLRRLG